MSNTSEQTEGSGTVPALPSLTSLDPDQMVENTCLQMECCRLTG